MSRRFALWGLSSLVAALLTVTAGAAYPVAAAPQGRPDTAARHVGFVTYNADLGADLAPLFTATSPADLLAKANVVYQSMLASDYPERAAAIAHLIASERPDLVGLQEADTWETSVSGAAFVMTENDFPTLIQAALAADGVPYNIVVKNLTVQAALPINGTTLVRFTDYNVVLARAGLPERMLAESNQQQGQFTARIPIPALGLSITRGWASADVTVWGRTFRFFDTHLEAYSEAVRTLQATQLAGMIASSPYPVVVVGDMNSYPPDCPGAIQTPAYTILETAGLVEVWPSAQQQKPCGGFTAGQSSLTSTTSNLDHRIDFVFFQPSKWDAIQAEVIGGQLRDKTPSGLWPSDHAGSVGTLRMDSGW